VGDDGGREGGGKSDQQFLTVIFWQAPIDGEPENPEYRCEADRSVDDSIFRILRRHFHNESEASEESRSALSCSLM
jgi:hypothetical protein